MHNGSSVVPVSSPQTIYTKAFLSLGEVIVAERPTHIWTVLGSCVSVILYNSRKKISALCHAQLAENEVFGLNGSGSVAEGFARKVVSGDFRYVGSSVEYMLEQMRQMGIKKNEIVASIYGGGNVITQFSRKIGDENVSMAFEMLKKHAITIIRKDVGGNKSRTIRYFSDTGTVHVKVL